MGGSTSPEADVAVCGIRPPRNRAEQVDRGKDSAARSVAIASRDQCEGVRPYDADSGATRVAPGRVRGEGLGVRAS